MTDGVLALRDLSQPHSTQRDSNPPEIVENPQRPGQLLSSTDGWLELELTDGGTPIADGAMVGIETTKAFWMGVVESRATLPNGQRLGIRIYHWLAVGDVSSVQKLWSHEQSD